MNSYQFFGIITLGVGFVLVMVALLALRQKLNGAAYTFGVLSLLVIGFGVVTFQLDASRQYDHPGQPASVGGVCRPEHFTNI